MEKDSTSFWADIKKFEDTLARDPKSYCFAPLSEVYRKLGLLDDAIATAKRGVEIHPEYVGGYMALGRAYYEKGMRQEARESLERVARATPENLLAQKLLSHIFQEEGNIPAAEQALRILVSFNPEDTESRLALEVLQRTRSTRGEAGPVEGDDEGGEAEETTPVSAGEAIGAGVVPREAHAASAPTEYPQDDGHGGEVFALDEEGDSSGPGLGEDATDAVPLSTITLAELYEAQGYNERALAVYQELLLNDPGSEEIRQRVETLRSLVEVEKRELSAVAGLDGEEGLLQRHAPEATVLPDVACAESGEDAFRTIGREDETVKTLEKWLDSIRRERACRSRKL
jgi:tetratricopeptide (TPR) repeat protein